MAPKNNKNNDLKNQLDEIDNNYVPNLDGILNDNSSVLPDINNITLYDYKKEEENIKKDSNELLNNLIDFYYEDLPELKANKYIKAKIKNDSDMLSNINFSQFLIKKLLIEQQKTIDSGGNSAGSVKVILDTFQAFKDTIEMSQKQRNNIEETYKKMRKDLGFDETVATSEITSVVKDDDSEKRVESQLERIKRLQLEKEKKDRNDMKEI